MTEYQPIATNSQNDHDAYRERCPDVSAIIAKKVAKTCSVKGLKRRLPITEWLPSYEKSFFLQDFVAGLSVGLTVIPQGIAYAVVAGLPPQYGLYSSFMGCFVYALFGSCKDVTIGPTAIMALMIHTAVVHLNVDFAILGTFLSGIVIFLFGFLNLGFLVNFISSPTIAAFVSAATITIGSGQIKPLLGIKSGSSNGFVESWINVVEHIDETRLSDASLGLVTLILLIGLKQASKVKMWSGFFKYIGIARNAIVVIMGIAIAYIFYINGSEPFRLTGEIKKGLPSFGPPPFSSELDGKQYDFGEMFHALGLSLITIPLVSILESVAIAKAFSKGKYVDATQEMIALGLCNIVSSFFSSIPITGSFTRTAVNHSSGVRTQFGGCFTGALVLLSLGLLTGTFYFIPKTVLAAVIIAAMISMIEVHEIVEIYKTRRADSIPFIATFLFSLWFGLEYGIIIGVAINVLFTLYNTSRPEIHFDIEKVEDLEVLVVSPDQSLIYSSAEYFKSSLLKKSAVEYPEAKLIVINGVAINFIDTTVVKVLTSIIEDLQLNGKKLCFWNWRRDAYHTVMRHNNQYFDLFRNSQSLCDLIALLKANEALAEIRADDS